MFSFIYTNLKGDLCLKCLLVHFFEVSVHLFSATISKPNMTELWAYHWHFVSLLVMWPQWEHNSQIGMQPYAVNTNPLRATYWVKQCIINKVHCTKSGTPRTMPESEMLQAQARAWTLLSHILACSSFSALSGLVWHIFHFFPIGLEPSYRPVQYTSRVLYITSMYSTVCTCKKFVLESCSNCTVTATQ